MGDFDDDLLHLCRRVDEGDVDSTKTKGSDRHLPIPKSLLLRMQTLGTPWTRISIQKSATVISQLFYPKHVLIRKGNGADERS